MKTLPPISEDFRVNPARRKRPEVLTTRGELRANALTRDFKLLSQTRAIDKGLYEGARETSFSLHARSNPISRDAIGFDYWKELLVPH